MQTIHKRVRLLSGALITLSLILLLLPAHLQADTSCTAGNGSTCTCGNNQCCTAHPGYCECHACGGGQQCGGPQGECTQNENP